MHLSFLFLPIWCTCAFIDGSLGDIGGTSQKDVQTSCHESSVKHPGILVSASVEFSQGINSQGANCPAAGGLTTSIPPGRHWQQVSNGGQGCRASSKLTLSMTYA